MKPDSGIPVVDSAVGRPPCATNSRAAPAPAGTVLGYPDAAWCGICSICCVR